MFGAAFDHRALDVDELEFASAEFLRCAHSSEQTALTLFLWDFLASGSSFPRVLQTSCGEC